MKPIIYVLLGETDFEGFAEPAFFVNLARAKQAARGSYEDGQTICMVGNVVQNEPHPGQLLLEPVCYRLRSRNRGCWGKWKKAK